MAVEANEVVEILLVEDNPTDAELTMEALNDGRIANHVVWVKDGAQALDFVFARGQYATRNMDNPPNVILLDLHLPKVSGHEVLKAIKMDPRTRTIPVVVLTSSQEDKDITESYQLGVNSYVSKPVEFEAFVDVVTRLGFYWLLVNRLPKR